MKAPKIIAEIGCNHKGDMQIAKEMIMTAATYCKADVVKFQKRCNRELLTPEEYNAPHPHPENSYGKTYGEHREFLEFTLEQHRQLQAWCNEYGIEYSTSVWDVTSAKEICTLKPKLIKVPSACNLNKHMLTYLCDNFEGDAVDSAAVALGAEWVERHFTLDRTWKGTDHAASLEPDGVRKLARDCRAVAKALTYKREDISTSKRCSVTN